MSEFQNGLPTSDVQSIALLGRTLYLGLNEAGYLATADIDSGRVTVVASAARRDAATPLDNTGSLRIPCILADPDRQRVVLAAFINRQGADLEKRNGLWQIDAKTGELSQLQQLYGNYLIRWASKPVGGQVLLYGGYLARYDLRTDRIELLYGSSPTTSLGPGLATTRNHHHVGGCGTPPLAWHDGWLWSGHGRTRVAAGQIKREHFAPLDPDHWLSREEQCLQVLPESKRLVVASEQCVWVIDLDKP